MADSPARAGAVVGRHRLPDAYLIDLSRIRPDPQQPRKRADDDAQRDLAASVRQFGVMQPISVRYLAAEDVYQIISGERRFLAAQAAGLAEMPCIIQAPAEEQILVRQVVENWQRAELHPFDLADALVALRDQRGMTQKQIAELTGKSESEVSRALTVLKLNPAVQQQARQDATGEVSRRHLTALAMVQTEEQPQLFREVKDKRLTAEQTEELVKDWKKRSTEPRRGAPGTRKIQLSTSKAIVTVAFRKRDVTTEDILQALDEARAKAASRAE